MFTLASGWMRGTDSRYSVTMEYVEKHIPVGAIITDLGGESPLAEMMRREYYDVITTGDVDLDEMPTFYHNGYVTSFEVFEHLLNPYAVLKSIKPGTKLLCSVPLNVWFSPEHWLDDDRKQHYHEFTERQFLKLLRKTGWTVKMSEKRRIVKSFGLRQLLRIFWPSYLFVYAEKGNTKK